MKTTKRVIAVVLAVLMIAMVASVAVTAATTKQYSFTLKCTKPGYEFTVYPLATIDDTTGAYTPVSTVTDTAVLNEINASKASTADLMALCQTSTGIGSGLADKFTSSATTTTKTYTQPAGIYFVKVTGVPIENTDVLGGAVVVLDKTVSEVDLSAKVKNGNEPSVDKDFSVNGSLTKADQTYGSDDTITYVLTADVPGSYTNQLTQYIITDTMGTGLNKTAHDVKSVVLKNGSNTTPLTYDVTTNASEIGDTATFGVKLKAAELAKEAFYAEGNKVVVTFESKIDMATAPIATNIPNSDALVYTNAGGSKTVPGPTVNFKTYKIQALKLDAQSGEKLAGATFTLYKADGTTVITTAVSSSDAENKGIANFNKLLPAGTYVVKETGVPNGYMLNTTPVTVVLGNDTTDTVTVTIEDTKTKTPSTGGAGTMMFTIIGGSLVLIAGALFVVVMKKRRSSK
jgi:LPXTG-motif cell wall-anchored protein